jgi:dTDP-4-dehydrorhamnose 3,5-epimerase
MSAGAVEALIRTTDEWDKWVTDHPGSRYEDQKDLKPPFFVLSRAVNAEGQPPQYLHHLFGTDRAREVLETKHPKFIDPPQDRTYTHAIKGVISELLKQFNDPRGHLVQLFRTDEITAMRRNNGPRIEFPPMAYLSVTEPGVARGPHEHLAQTDIFIFCRAEFEVFLWDARKGSETYWRRQKILTNAHAYHRVIVPPGVVHAYRALGKQGTVVNCPDKLYAGWDQQAPVDEIRHETNPDSPFRLW